MASLERFRQSRRGTDANHRLRRARAVAVLLEGTDVTATIYHAATQDADMEATAQALTAVASALEEAGIESRRVSTTIERPDEPLEALVAAANEHDLLVIGEDEPTLTDRLFGETSERIAERTTVPIVVVRRPPVET